MAYGVERQSKRLLYGCEECGDCNLPDCAYLCPRHACSKGSVNGPCGGSAEGRCELDDKDCFWARVYERLKTYGESEQMLDRPVNIYNPQLKNTSSWANFYLDRDHSAPKGGRRKERRMRGIKDKGHRRAGGVSLRSSFPPSSLTNRNQLPCPFRR